MKPGISKQQRRLLSLLATPIGGWKGPERPAWPVRELRRVFLTNGAGHLPEVKAIEQAEHSTRRALRALKARGLVTFWDGATFEARVVGHGVMWVETPTPHVPGHTERMLGITVSDAGLKLLGEAE